MQAVSYSEARKRMKEYLDHVYENHDPLIITRKNNENVVVISLEDYNALTETNYLLASGSNKRHLFASLENVERGELLDRDIYEEE